MWTMFAAATMKDNTTRNELVHSIFQRATFNQSMNRNFPLIYDTNDTSVQVTEGSNPQQGAMFALLALRCDHLHFARLGHLLTY